jgi:hypothetical protein
MTWKLYYIIILYSYVLYLTVTGFCFYIFKITYFGIFLLNNSYGVYVTILLGIKQFAILFEKIIVYGIFIFLFYIGIIDYFVIILYEPLSLANNYFS